MIERLPSGEKSSSWEVDPDKSNGLVLKRGNEVVGKLWFDVEDWSGQKERTLYVADIFVKKSGRGTDQLPSLVEALRTAADVHAAKRIAWTPVAPSMQKVTERLSGIEADGLQTYAVPVEKFTIDALKEMLRLGLKKKSEEGL